MPRSPRVIVAGGIYHIFARGNNKADIFLDNIDRLRYLRLAIATMRALRVRLLAYVLMSNHVHLVLQIAEPNLAAVMHHMHQNYAIRFNRRHGHTGHTFNSRYNSKIIIEDIHLLETTRYVHLNPVRAGLVKVPEDYVWSSYGQYVRQEANRMVDPTPVLSILADDPARSRVAYVKFVLDALNDESSKRNGSPWPGSRPVVRR